ncbi:TetR/AcrR family transcriptional regulator [Roseomonas sp. GCM10028921]
MAIQWSGTNLNMRDQIKAAATDLFIARGYRGLTFVDLAAQIGIPRPNLHYYFLNKAQLAEEVLAGHTGRIVSLYAAAWMARDIPMPQKFGASLAAIRSVHGRYNPNGDEGRPWGLIARFVHERDAITDAMREILRRTHRRYQLCATVAVRQAVRRGELVADAPRDELALLVTCLMRFAGELTVHSRGFERVELHYAATRRTIGRAYGTEVWRRALERDAEPAAGIPSTPASCPPPAPPAPSGEAPPGSGRRNPPAPGMR